MSLHISHDTIQEMKEALFPTVKGMIMAEHAVQFLIDQGNRSDIPAADIGTLRKFLEFLKEKNYN
jgi:hypothetical protein